MDTEYCHECGILHDPEDGDCLGCELVAKIKALKDEFKREHKLVFDYSEQIRSLKLKNLKLLKACDDQYNVTKSLKEKNKQLDLWARKVYHRFGVRMGEGLVSEMRQALEWKGVSDE